MGTIDDTLEELHRLLPDIANQLTRPDAARPFASAFYGLYTERSKGLEPDQAELTERFLTGSAHIIEPALPFLDYHLSDRVEARLNAGAEADDWPIICELRSTLEALKELYAPHLPMGELIPDDPDLDAAIKASAEDKAPAAPVGFGSKHWWWARSP